MHLHPAAILGDADRLNRGTLIAPGAGQELGTVPAG
jgi:hypothetical protein